jgi:hypothetical protein
MNIRHESQYTADQLMDILAAGRGAEGATEHGLGLSIERRMYA